MDGVGFMQTTRGFPTLPLSRPICAFPPSKPSLPPLPFFESVLAGVVPWRREQEPPVERERLQSTRTQTTLLILRLSGRKILLYPHRERKSKKGLRIQTKINKTSILGRWLEPIFSHTLKFILWQRKTLHMKSGL